MLPNNEKVFFGDKRDAILAKGWAPGNYTNKCHTCGEMFTGDKRAWTCADCAYGEENK
jgi:hypothetical protein